MTTRNRAAVKRRLTALATKALEGSTDGQGRPVTVSYTWNGDDVTDSTFFLGPAEGPSEPTAMGQEKRRSQDTFTIKGYVQVNGYAGGEAAEAAAELVLVTFEEYLTSGPKNLRHPDVPFDSPPDFNGVESAYIGDVNGPRHSFPQGDLVNGWIEFDITCKTNIH